VDSQNLFPLLNNYLFAAEASSDDHPDSELPWSPEGALSIFPNAGLAVARAGGRLLVCGRGGTVKLWEGQSLVYEDCGYLIEDAGQRWTSQTQEGFAALGPPPDVSERLLEARVLAPFCRVPPSRMAPARFLGFRAFMLTFGRLHRVALWLKWLLVRVLIKRTPEHPAALDRRILFDRDGTLALEDHISGASVRIQPVARQVPIHMGSARYADSEDALGARLQPIAPRAVRSGEFARSWTLRKGGG
jgi:hypothetical protein